MPHPQNWLRRYRKEAGLTQLQVAKALKLKNSASVSRWERGTRTPTIRRLLELSVLYSRLVNDLYRPEYLEIQGQIRGCLSDDGCNVV